MSLPNKIELKNIKINEAFSDDSTMFRATVYVDGKRRFEASDDGYGGEMALDGIPGVSTNQEAFAFVKAFDDECIKRDLHFDFHNTKLHLALSVLVSEMVEEQRLKLLLKKQLRKISIIQGGELFSYPAKHKPTPENLAQVKAFKDFKEGSVLLNDIPFNEALELYRAYMGWSKPKFAQ